MVLCGRPVPEKRGSFWPRTRVFIASMTDIPVLGVTIPASTLGGLDSLLSIVQMPSGVPVATMAIGKSGAKNAAILAVQILALSDKDLAEKLDITVSEQNLRKTGPRVKSGLCKVRGKHLFIMDKHLPIHKKNQNLASCLKKISHEDIYVVPAVRDFIKNQFG